VRHEGVTPRRDDRCAIGGDRIRRTEQAHDGKGG
jgi:hypothetical protein